MAEQYNYADLFRDSESRVQRAVLVVDINESTKFKAESAEVAWIPTYGWFFDIVATIIEQCGGEVVKFVGDGVLAVFEDERVENAINAAILCQEAITEAREVERKVNISCSVGISHGRMIRFPMPTGGYDYIGQTVDRAFRLQSAANANAIFADSDAVSAASMTKVRSKIGEALNRSASEYHGEPQAIPLKGFVGPVRYFEIFWTKTLFSVSAPYAGNLVLRPENKTGQRVSVGNSDHASKGEAQRDRTSSNWLSGRVTRAAGEQGFGFIAGPDEDFFFAPELLFFSSSNPRTGDNVVFQPLPPTQPGKSRRADRIFVVGEQVTATFNRGQPGGFGFAEVQGRGGQTHSLFVLLGPDADFHPGEMLECTISENAKGPIGRDVRRL